MTSLNAQQTSQNKSMLPRYYLRPKILSQRVFGIHLVDCCSRHNPKILAAEETFILSAVTESKIFKYRRIEYLRVQQTKATLRRFGVKCSRSLRTKIVGQIRLGGI